MDGFPPSRVMTGKWACVFPGEHAGSLTDHDTDALIAAAGLRHIAGDPTIWSPPGLDALARSGPRAGSSGSHEPGPAYPGRFRRCRHAPRPLVPQALSGRQERPAAESSCAPARFASTASAPTAPRRLGAGPDRCGCRRWPSRSRAAYKPRKPVDDHDARGSAQARVLYRDDWVIVIDKPYGPCRPGRQRHDPPSRWHAGCAGVRRRTAAPCSPARSRHLRRPGASAHRAGRPTPGRDLPRQGGAEILLVGHGQCA